MSRGETEYSVSFLNLGKKDEFGKQTRIEHRGKHLRASRTGGVSLRAQTKAAGLNLTANSRHGVRVSRSVGKNTQMALQNGRFILRGRYGSGATKANLSKSGITFSTRNQLGSFNWVKPNRSSAKVFGVQVRGKNAATAHLFFMLFTVLIEVARVALLLLLLLLNGLWRLLGVLWRLLSMTPFALQQALRYWRNLKIQRMQNNLPAVIPSAIGSWKAGQLVTAIQLVVLGWGRGIAADKALPAVQQAAPVTDIASDKGAAAIIAELNCWQQLAPEDNEPVFMLAVLSLLGQQAARQLEQSVLPELLLQMDDLALQQGPKTRFQEKMLEVFSDAAGLRVVI